MQARLSAFSKTYPKGWRNNRTNNKAHSCVRGDRRERRRNLTPVVRTREADLLHETSRFSAWQAALSPVIKSPLRILLSLHYLFPSSPWASHGTRIHRIGYTTTTISPRTACGRRHYITARRRPRTGLPPTAARQCPNAPLGGYISAIQRLLLHHT